jgi:CheY-like chemotaxis protein
MTQTPTPSAVEPRPAELAADAARAKQARLEDLRHRLLAPMDAVVQLSATLADSSLSRAQQECAEALEGQAQQLVAGVEDLLALVTMDDWAFLAQSVAFDLPPLIERIKRAASGRAGTRSMVVAQTVAPDIPTTLVGDADVLSQILAIVLDHVVDQARTGAVVLSARLAGSSDTAVRVRFEAAEVGRRAPETRPEPDLDAFTRAVGAERLRSDQRARDIALCRRLVALRGGSALGTYFADGGAAFAIEFDFALPSAEGEDSPGAILSGRRVLLVQDHPINRRATTALLQGAGMHVEAVMSSGAALDRLARELMHLVVVDCDGAEGTAWLTARRIRQAGAPWASVPVVGMASSRPGDAPAPEGTEHFDALVTKPVTAVQLTAALAQQLRQRR